MICKYIRRKLNQLPLNEEFGQICGQLLAQIDGRNRQRMEQYLSKAQIITTFCFKLLKILETIFSEDEIGVGLTLLRLIKSLILEIYEAEKLEIYLIKIRMYLLSIRWTRQRGESLQNLTVRLNLFIEQVMNTSFYDFISQDCYSQIERLYIEAIRQNIREEKIEQSVNLINACFESMKRQFSELLQKLGLQEKKVYSIIEKKVQVFIILYKFQMGIKEMTASHDSSSSRANSLFDRYQSIINRLPVAVDKQKEGLMYSQVVPFKKTLREQKSCIKTNALKKKFTTFSLPSISSTVSKQSSSVCDALVFVNDLQNKGNVLENQKTIEDMWMPSNSFISSNRTSRFRALSLQTQKRVKIDFRDKGQPNQIVKREVFKDIVQKGSMLKCKGQKMAKAVVKTKAFSLVVRNEKDAKQKLRCLNPLKGRQWNLNLCLSQSQRISNGLCIHFGGIRL